MFSLRNDLINYQCFQNKIDHLENNIHLHSFFIIFLLKKQFIYFSIFLLFLILKQIVH